MPEPPRASRPFEQRVVFRAIQDIEPRSTYLEIGSSRGGSLASFGMLFPKASKLLAVDKAADSKNGRRNRVVLEDVIAGLQGGYEAQLVSGNSTQASVINAVAVALGEKSVDVLFIDGGHTGDIVFQDVINYVPFVRPGGLVIMHDVGPVIHPRNGVDLVAKAEYPVVISDCFAAWRSLASKHARKMIVQEGHGYGLVWID